jgi:hypothetical protein
MQRITEKKADKESAVGDKIRKTKCSKKKK